MIEVTNLSKSYGKDQTLFQALDNINLQIENGQTVAIIGKSGSGKSTLMHCLSGLDKAQQGTVTIDGEDISKLSPNKTDQFRAERMGFVFQSFFVQGNESCMSNVSLPLETANVARNSRPPLIESALESVDLLDKKNSLAKNLSGGQKQRLAIARAIVNNPDILFADEPTGNLDSQTGQLIIDLLFSYNQKHHGTLIIVTHDTDLAKKCSMQVYLKDGQIEKIDSTASTKRKKK